MLVETNWGNFAAKFNGREQKAFEWMCSLLFYKEHGKSTGALRFFNQPGIEAEPIKAGDDIIGFQAKYLGSALAAQKNELIRAIDTANKQHPDLTKIYFYLNVDFGRSNKPGEGDPTYKKEIEEHAQKYGIAITWKTAGFFETPFVTEANANIAAHFFTLSQSMFDFVEDVARHTSAMLDPIHTEIISNGLTIKIDRHEITERLKTSLQKASVVIVSGEAGVGKTAVIKDFYKEVKANAPFYLFKATEFNVSHINRLFEDYGNFTVNDFIREHEEFTEKYVVIDSAEKLSDLERPEAFQELLSRLRDTGWRVLFTTRLSYLDDLKFLLLQLYRTAFEPIAVRGLALDELAKLFTKYSFELPDNIRLRELLTNPFYLNEYIGTDLALSGKASYADFKDSLWDRRIVRSAFRKNSIDRKRDDCFTEIAQQRASSGNFFVSIQGHDEALEQLAADEIIAFDKNAGGYFITHDIYEEWALERIIERAFHGLVSYTQFYQVIGDSLPMRRAFRGWLSEKLALNNVDAARLIEDTVSDQALSQHMRDEVITASLLSDHSERFFQTFENNLIPSPTKTALLNNNPADQNSLPTQPVLNLLQRVLFLLRISCKEVDQSLMLALEATKQERFDFAEFMTRPKGSGWESALKFLDQHKSELARTYMPLIVPVLEDWNRTTKRGEATKAATSVALYLFEELAGNEEYRYSFRSDVGKQLIQVIFNGSGEAKEALSAIFNDVVNRKDTHRLGPYHELCKTAISSLDKSAVVAINLPEEVMALAELFWPYTPPQEDRWGSDYRNDIEQYFDLAPDDHDSYPASAFQTPTLRLLQVTPVETVKFLLRFINKSIEYFAKSEFAEHEVREISLYIDDQTKTTQFISHRLWNLYRGTQASPTLLESLHMALERWLLDEAKAGSTETIAPVCFYLLQNSRSASITAVVVSAVISQPSKLYEVAKHLFRTKEIFAFDQARAQLESSTKSHFSIAHDPDRHFVNERLATCDQPYRKSSLEHIALNYQMFRDESVSEGLAKERQEQIWAILDAHYKDLPEKSQESERDKDWRLCLARMDRRKMTIATEQKDDKVILTFNPKIDPELEKYSIDSLAKVTDSMKHLSLSLWARYRWEGENQKSSEYPQYESAPSQAAAETRAVFEGLKVAYQEDDSFRLFYRAVPPTSCAVLIRDFCDLLSVEDREFCKDVVMLYAALPLHLEYSHQIGDGLEVATVVLPLLIKPFPETRVEVKRILLFTLLDRSSVGMSDRVSYRAAKAITQTLRDIDGTEADSLFLAYLYLQPKFSKLCGSMREENRRKNKFGFNFKSAVKRFEHEQKLAIDQSLTNKIAFCDLLPLKEISIDALVTAFALLPVGSPQEEHKQFVTELSAIIFSHVRRQPRQSEKEVDYGVRLRFLKGYAGFVLSSQKADIARFIQPLIDNFETLDYAEDVFQEFISAEDKLIRYDEFWQVWHMLYPKFVELCEKRWRSSSSTPIHNYLLAWPWWNKHAKEWHSLRDREKTFFHKVSIVLGHHPSVLYSLAKLFNEIGSSFAFDGIIWLSSVLQNHPKLRDEELEVNTIYYLENLVRSYVLLNRQNIRKTPQAKAAVVIVLNFLIDKGSVTAYMAREYIL
jgi:Cdc6-like AAA superfamily ATPase